MLDFREMRSKMKGNKKHRKNMKQKLNVHEIEKKKQIFINCFNYSFYIDTKQQAIFLCWNFKFFGVCFIAINMIIG